MIKRGLYVLAIALGIFLVVYGGYDDSPGGQVLGLLLAIFGFVRLIVGRKGLRRDKHR